MSLSYNYEKRLKTRKQTINISEWAANKIKTCCDSGIHQREGPLFLFFLEVFKPNLASDTLIVSMYNSVNVLRSEAKQKFQIQILFKK